MFAPGHPGRAIDRIGDGSPAFTDLLCDILLAHAEFIREARVSLRFLDRIKIGALQILN